YTGLPENWFLRMFGYAWSFGTIWPAIFEGADLISVWAGRAGRAGWAAQNFPAPAPPALPPLPPLPPPPPLPTLPSLPPRPPSPSARHRRPDAALAVPGFQRCRPIPGRPSVARLHLSPRPPQHAAWRRLADGESTSGVRPARKRAALRRAVGIVELLGWR